MTQSNVRAPERPSAVSGIVGGVGVTTNAGLVLRGFRGSATVQDLVDKGVPPDPGLRHCGVYAVVAPPGYEPTFVPPEAARERGNVLCPWPVDRLRSKWVPSTETVYIGVAGIRTLRTLTDRLRELARHASGRIGPNGPDKGGSGSSKASKRSRSGTFRRAVLPRRGSWRERCYAHSGRPRGSCRSPTGGSGKVSVQAGRGGPSGGRGDWGDEGRAERIRIRAGFGGPPLG